MAFEYQGQFTTHNSDDDHVIANLPKWLSESLPKYRIEVQFYRTKGLTEAVQQGNIDIFFGSSGCYASLLPDGVFPLATVATNRAPDPNAAVAGSLIVRTDREDLQTISDLKGKSAISGLPSMFFNYQMPMSALLAHGYDPESFFSTLLKIDSPVLQVLDAVSRGRVDVGLIRACTLEELPLEERKKYRVIEPQKESPLRCQHTSNLFPNWTMGALKTTHPEMAKDVAIALLSSQPTADRGIRWTLASKFSNLDDLYRELKTGRYEYLRHWTINRLVQVYWPVFILIIIGLLGLVIYLMRVRHLLQQSTTRLNSEMKTRLEIEKKSADVNDKFSRLQRMGVVGMMSNMIAHELRQPLATIRYLNSTLQMIIDHEGRINPLMEKIASGIKKQTEKINQIVEQVRSYSKTGGTRNEKIDVAGLLEEVKKELFQMKAKAKINIQCPDNLIILGNHLELQLVFINLIKNSIEASKTGTSEINLTTFKAAHQCAVITLRDRSRHLTVDDWQRILHGAPSGKPSGMGVGLSIVRSIIESHCGIIEFEACSDIGLQTTITLPMAE